MFFDSNLDSFTFKILNVLRLNCQAPDVPGLAHQGQNGEKISPFLTVQILWKKCQYYRIIVEVIIVL